MKCAHETILSNMKPWDFWERHVESAEPTSSPGEVTEV